MLMDFFKTFVAHCTDQSKVVPSRLPFSGSEREILYWNPDAKEVCAIAVERKDKAHRFLSLESLILFINTTEHENRAIIWVGDDAITLELNEHSEADLLTYGLRFTELFRQIKALVDNPRRAQAEAVKLFRQWFAEFDPGAQALTAVRSLKLSRSSESESTIAHDMSRIGKSLIQSAAGGEALPEFIEIQTPVFDHDDADPESIKLWISIDFERNALLIEPDAQQYAAALIQARRALVEHLTSVVDADTVLVVEGNYEIAS
jgi:hypothetical protein